ncbi:MAG TPA: SpoIID/LytB domain-containing protein [Candidatus Eisenbergiella intestinipullorum]|nr:SpoIID/LytB domain-containing protein [Candidatus Eisenbergiella intestinipullorum]
MERSRGAGNRNRNGAGSISRLQNTARRQKLRDLCAVFLFLLLLPYACSLLFGKEEIAEETAALSGQDGLRVICGTDAGRLLVPLEEYVEGALAASISAESGTETLKAQAVILRTLCLRAWMEENGVDPEAEEQLKSLTAADRVSAEAAGQKYLDAAQRRQLWGEEYEENEVRMEEAVRQTEGMYLTLDGRVLEPAYFQLSAGKTRDGSEVLGEGYEYLVSVDCSHDIEAEDYIRTVALEEEDFRRRLGCESGDTITLTRDSADYVLYVDTGAGRISGESFRELFGLASSCFTISEEKGKICLTSRGVGHGLGFCQHEADRRAAEGEDYLGLLAIFFEGADVHKNG